MNRFRWLAVATAVLALGIGTVASASAALIGQSAHRHGPHIVAKPGSVMVNTSTTLTGTGFKPHRRLVIQECSLRNWVVPQRVCNHPNTVKVRTDAHGRFTVTFKALVCPKSKHVQPAGFSRTCWVGVPVIQGIDTEHLLGAAKLIVTGP